MEGNTNRRWLLGAALLVAGCGRHDPEKAARECQALTSTALPNDGSNPERFAQQTDYARACMKARGFALTDHDPRCRDVGVEGNSIDASCFG